MENLCDPKVVKYLLDRFGFRFSKDLGQNFLIDGEVPRSIAESCGVDSESGVLEIGPGFGVLTHELAKRAKNVVAVEIDSKLMPILKHTLYDHDNIEMINQDVMKLDLPALLKEKFGTERVFVCANLPYYITTPIIMTLLEQRLAVDSITVMVQKEVAKRLCAAPGEKEAGAVSAAVYYYTEPELLFEVGKESFMPKPKVDSAVIRLRVRSEPPVRVKNEKFLFSLVKGAFAQRRKTFLNSVSSAGIGITKERAADALRQLGISETIRGERLSMEDFANLCDILCN